MVQACEGGTCQLFGLFGIVVQCMIGVWCVLTLLVLWRMETPRRSFMTWVGDMSKQMVGAGWGHFMNIFLAIILGEAVDSASYNNQCVWYLVGFLSDIILVTFLAGAVTISVRPVFAKRCGIDIGDYSGGNDSGIIGQAEQPPLPPWMMWSLQTLIWICILTTVKLFVSFVCYLAQDVLYGGLAWSFHAVGLCGHHRAQLLTSVVLVPVVGDAFQMAVQDGFLKKRAAQGALTESEEGSDAIQLE